MIILCILIIFLFLTKKNQNSQFQEELIFFKLFSSGSEESQNTLLSKNQIQQLNETYNFNVSYKNIDFKNIYLTDTIRKDTLIHKKIAPRNRRNI